MPYDPLSPDRLPECYRTQVEIHPRPCRGSRCSAWRPQVNATYLDGPRGRPLSERVATALWNAGLRATLGLGRIEALTPTGLGVCAENPDALPWRDPQAPKEGGPDAG